MPGSDEDKRLAATTTVSLSSLLITVSLGVIAAQAVIVTFVLDKRHDLVLFTFFSGLGLLSSVISIIFGGRGIAELLKRGFDGDWVCKTDTGHFNRQAITVLVGLIAVAISVFCGDSKSEKYEVAAEASSLQAELRDSQQKLEDLKVRLENLSEKIKNLTPFPAEKKTNRK